MVQLPALGVSSENIYGMDRREDRCIEARDKYGISIVRNENEMNFSDLSI
mgnify:CR=1 FL=1